MFSSFEYKYDLLWKKTNNSSTQYFFKFILREVMIAPIGVLPN